MKTDKDHSNLIESLKKLIKFAANGSQCQREIFSSFNRNDFQKIMQNFDDENAILRQLSFKLMSLLLSKNRENRIEFCKVFDVFPIKGRLILNKISDKLITPTTDVATLLSKLRQADFANNRQMYLSSYNEHVLPLEHKNFPDDSFLDPWEAVIMVMVEEETLSPRKSFFNEEKVSTQISTPRRKVGGLWTNKQHEYGIDYVNMSGTVTNSPHDSTRSYSSKARRQ